MVREGGLSFLGIHPHAPVLEKSNKPTPRGLCTSFRLAPRSEGGARPSRARNGDEVGVATVQRHSQNGQLLTVWKDVSHATGLDHLTRK